MVPLVRRFRLARVGLSMQSSASPFQLISAYPSGVVRGVRQARRRASLSRFWPQTRSVQLYKH